MKLMKNLTIAEAAKKYRVAIGTIHLWIKKGNLLTTKESDGKNSRLKTYIDGEALDAFATTKKSKSKKTKGKKNQVFTNQQKALSKISKDSSKNYVVAFMVPADSVFSMLQSVFSEHK